MSVEIDSAPADPAASDSPATDPGLVAAAVVDPAVVSPPIVESTVVTPSVVVGGSAVPAPGLTPPPSAPAGPARSVSAAPAAGTEAAGTAAMEPVDIEDIEPLDIESPAAAPLPFGIADAIQLMRSLPSDPNIDLVVRVVRVTLGAVNVSVEEIMEDARRKEKGIQDEISVLEGEVGELEKQVYTRRCEIAAREADLRETANVRERLYQADKYNGHRPPPAPPDAARVAHPKPADWTGPDHSSKG